MRTTEAQRHRARLDGELGDVAGVRHSVGGWLRDWDMSGLVEDVELVTSELVTNAILHAGGEIDVVLERRGGGVCVLVRDGRPDLVPAAQQPPPARAGDDEMDRLARAVFEGNTTGRGLLLVDAFADAWGVDLAPASKAVWAELGTGRAASAGDGPPPLPAAPRGAPVVLRRVPVRLVLLSAANMDDLVRELQTTDFPTQAASDLASLAELLVQETLPQREPLRLAARSALESRDRRVDVSLEVPTGQVGVLRRFVSLTDQVADLCRAGVLLSEAPADEVTAFRRWYVEELDRQVRGDPPAPCPFPE